MDVRVRSAGSSDLAAASTVLGEAFVDYAWTDWTVDADDHLARLTALQRLALEHDVMPFGEVWLAEIDGTIHCAAAWIDTSRTTQVAQQPMLIYDCRHAAATTWLRAGMPLAETARRLGHSVETLVSPTSAPSTTKNTSPTNASTFASNPTRRTTTQ